MEIRQIIEDAMERKGMTQRALQAMTGIWQHRISDYLTGKHDVNAETLRKMLEALDLEIRPRRGRGKPGAPKARKLPTIRKLKEK